MSFEQRVRGHLKTQRGLFLTWNKAIKKPLYLTYVHKRARSVKCLILHKLMMGVLDLIKDSTYFHFEGVFMKVFFVI